MRSAQHVQITTPKKVCLDGLLLGPVKATRVVIWVHGLGSSLFSKLAIADELVNRDTAVLVFNNRGHDKVAKVSQGKKRILGGSAHEVFTDCVDDIDGAIHAAKSFGAKEIFLAGHSTGCQKSIYWAAKRGLPVGRQGKGVKGIILLAPISDYAAEVKLGGDTKIKAGLKVAKQMTMSGRKNELVPVGAQEWFLIADAQRFLSLYSGESAEEIFTYWAPQRVPTTLRAAKLPILALLAEKDEYRDRPSAQMADWFAEHLKIGDQVVIVPKVGHSFEGGEKAVARHMHKFMTEAAQ